MNSGCPYTLKELYYLLFIFKGSKYKQILSENIGVSLIIIMIIIIIIIVIIYSFIHVSFVQTGVLSLLHKKNEIETYQVFNTCTIVSTYVCCYDFSWRKRVSYERFLLEHGDTCFLSLTPDP